MAKRRYNEARLLKSRMVRKAQKHLLSVGEQTEKILASGPKDFALVKGELHRLFDETLATYSYLALIDNNGQCVVHTNRLRENMIFMDPVGARCVQSPTPIDQVYYRDTGEVCIDCACPIQVNGHRQYTLRLGIAYIPQKISYKLLAAFLASWLAPTLLGSVLTGWQPAYLLYFLITALPGSWAFLWLNNQLDQSFEHIFSGATAIAYRDLTQVNEPVAADELGQVTCEINKMAIGLRAMVRDLREVANRIAKAGDSQAKATNEGSMATQKISATMQHVAADMREQNEQITDATRILAHITETMSGMASNVKETLELSHQTVNKADIGARAVSESIEQMNQIRQTVSVSSQVIHDLNEKSHQISAIINAITNIADQTHLLALNAAIESARAGEQGRGFAIVAEQVRQLAEESARSAQEIMNIIEETRVKTTEAAQAMETGAQQVDHGVEVIADAGQSIEEIVASVRATSRHVQENDRFAMILKEDSSALLEELHKALEIAKTTTEAALDISAAVEEQTAVSEEIAASASELSQTATLLEDSIRGFHI